MLEDFDLWRKAFGRKNDGLDAQREVLAVALRQFRERVAHLVGEIGAYLPQLTVHDITHLDALWRVANEIGGPSLELNPAEAFVFGGAVLLHDAAHAAAAYEGGLVGIKQSVQWRDLVAQRFGGVDPSPGSPDEKFALFVVLRELHATQARRLPYFSWALPTTGEKLFLIEHSQLRDYYGDLIGEIAESHHWSPHEIGDAFDGRFITAPGSISPAGWVVDPVKIAFLLRTADAAHVDSQRAPWFLFALRNPEGISQGHWDFQSRLGQPHRTEAGELRISAGSPFDASRRESWWLAYDAACLIDRELRSAAWIMKDLDRQPFAACGVENISTPEQFAINVPTTGWEPVNVVPLIGNVPKVIENMGGAQLYGDKPELAIRELIQNAADAIRALRALRGASPTEGTIEVALDRGDAGVTISVTDTGVGMSRYVICNVLLDFGNSLWGGDAVRRELPGLASRGFSAVGRFGIGFYSVFMLGRAVAVTTRRFVRKSGEQSEQWRLEFPNGLVARPALMSGDASQQLQRSGTRVEVLLSEAAAASLLKIDPSVFFQSSFSDDADGTALRKAAEEAREVLLLRVARLCPTLDIDVDVRVGTVLGRRVVQRCDWETLAPEELIGRASSTLFRSSLDTSLVDVRECDGSLVGRLSYVGRGFWNHAAVTYLGMSGGSVNELSGVLLGKNNADLQRKSSVPIATKRALSEWATNWLRSTKGADLDARVALQVLIPDHDLAVYRLGRRQLTAREVATWCEEQVGVYVHFGEPSHESYDEVSRDSFSQSLEMADDVLVVPEYRGSLVEDLGFDRIDYRSRVEKLFASCWGMEKVMEVDGASKCIGEVNGTDIERECSYYARTEFDI